jgi:hypothetical protein
MRTLRAPPEELSEVGGRQAAPRKDFGPSVWFAVSGGRDAGPSRAGCCRCCARRAI